MAFWAIKIFLSVCKKDDQKHEIGVFITEGKGLKILSYRKAKLQSAKIYKLKKPEAFKLLAFLFKF